MLNDRYTYVSPSGCMNSVVCSAGSFLGTAASCPNTPGSKIEGAAAVAGTPLASKQTLVVGQFWSGGEGGGSVHHGL